MEIYEAHEPKWLLYILVPCSSFIIFLISFFILSETGSEDIPYLLLGGFAFLMLTFYTLFDLLRRKIVLYYNHIAYTPSIGKTRTFSYHDVSYMAIRGLSYVLYDANHKRLASFETNMHGGIEVLLYLTKRGILLKS